MRKIKDYIWRDLGNPIAAGDTVKGIIRKVNSLSIFPQRQPLLDDKLNNTKGLRMLPYKNYNIFYYYDMKEDVVYIIRVLYGRCDWKSVMK